MTLSPLPVDSQLELAIEDDDDDLDILLTAR